jgi:site-specific DNA-cytosine methylase
MNKNYRKLKVLGVSQGQGTLLFPLRRQVIGNIEPRGCFHTPKEEQWKANFNDIPFVRRKEEIANYRDADIIIGSPNCGTSSILSYSRKKSLGKPKEDESLKLFIEVTSEVKPSLFVMENLPKLLDFISPDEWQGYFPDYDLIFHNNSVMDFGNSQKSRVRLLIIGVKKGQVLVNKKVFTRIYKAGTPKLSRRLTKSSRNKGKYAPSNGNVRELLEHKVCMYDYRDPEKTKLTLARIQELWTNDFKDHYKWPINSKKMKTLPGVYRNHPDRYPMTARKQDRQFRPDGYIMSPRELANIQGFPSRYRIYCVTDPYDSKYKYWINKGRVTVTKGPSYQMGLWLKGCLKKL